MTIPERFGAGETGAIAWRRLASLPEAGSPGRIIAAFSAAFYVDIGPDLICIATAKAEPAPLTVRSTAPVACDWRQFGIAPGQVLLARRSGLEVPGRVRIGLAGAREWRSDAPPAGRPSEAIAAGLAALAKAMPADRRALGFGAFIRPGFPATGLGREIAAAAAPVAAAQGWLVDALRSRPQMPMGDLSWSARLVGLGPGLTPSGDDFLGGVMIALRALGAGAACDRLWAEMRPHLATRTNRISAALLAAAAEGHGGASLHAAVGALLDRGDGLQSALAGLARIGHSSGWDALAGAVAVLEAELTARATQAA